MKNAKLRENVKYCAMQAIYWMLACICVAYAGVFLPARGYSNAEYGVIMAAGYVLGMLLLKLLPRVDYFKPMIAPKETA